MLDYGYGDDFEREEADRADTASETAFAVLHGYSLPHTMGPDTRTDPTSRLRISSQASASDPSNGAEASETNRKEAA